MQFLSEPQLEILTSVTTLSPFIFSSLFHFNINLCTTSSYCPNFTNTGAFFPVVQEEECQKILYDVCGEDMKRTLPLLEISLSPTHPLPAVYTMDAV